MAWTRRTLGGVLLAAAAVSAAVAAPRRPRPVVIAHRGASGERPEHTLAAYRLAIAQGADFIEPDLVVTRDGHLVCRHENEVGETTDVGARPEFAARRTTKIVDGRRVDGWFAEDFTLAELKTLRCRERIPQLRPGNTAFDGLETIPTFLEAVAVARSASRTVGVYPELKHPTFLASQGHDVVALMVQALKAARLTRRNSPVYVQCFEVEPLRRLRALTRVQLVQLVSNTGGPADVAGRTYASMLTPAGLREIAAYADAIGPEKTLVLPRGPDDRSLAPTRLVADAHSAGLSLHPWTCRAENLFLPAELRRGDSADPAYRRLAGDMEAECRALFEAGVDGVFSDHPAAAVAARNRWARERL
jgi:glycerophosphoryl diester phosphodiesterase